MRIHIDLDPVLVDRVDDVAGPRGRTRFIREAVEWALAQESRWESLRSVLGSVDDEGHEWDAGPAEWVRKQRRADKRRVG